MTPAAENGHKNTAAKQLPLWLRPAVPTIRKLLKNGATNQRGNPLPHALRLYSVQPAIAAMVIIGSAPVSDYVMLLYSIIRRKSTLISGQDALQTGNVLLFIHMGVFPKLAFPKQIRSR